MSVDLKGKKLLELYCLKKKFIEEGNYGLCNATTGALAVEFSLVCGKMTAHNNRRKGSSGKIKKFKK